MVYDAADGSLKVGHHRSFESHQCEVVHRFGRPYYIQESYSLGDKFTPHVTFTRNFPFGVIIEADPAARLSFNDLPMDRVRELSTRNSIVLLRGFYQVDREDFVKKCAEMGNIL